MSDLTSTYRPRTLDEVVGQQAACAVLQRAVAANSSHAFLLSGPSGVGKTTLARIGAALLAAEVQEIDAATFTGIDAMREVQDSLGYQPLYAARRAIVVDEAHRLSKQAWDSMLKSVEEPPPHGYWFFCTTEPSKVPATVRNRCTELRLRPLNTSDLIELLVRVDRDEGLQTEFDILNLCAREAQGSARKALVNLAAVQGLSASDARALLREAAAPAPVVELYKVLANGGTWLQAIAALAKLDDEPESIRIQLSNYIAAVLRNAQTDKDATFLLDILEQFSQPYHPGEKQAPLMLSIGRVLFYD
jgi:DNA polymerase III gamma/tau subunit